MFQITWLTVIVFSLFFVPFVLQRCRKLMALKRAAAKDMIQLLRDVAVVFVTCVLLSLALRAVLDFGSILFRNTNISSFLFGNWLVPSLIALFALAVWRCQTHIEVRAKEPEATGAFFRDIAIVGSLCAILAGGVGAIVFASMIVFAPTGHSPPLLAAAVPIAVIIAIVTVLSFVRWRANRAFVIRVRPGRGKLLLRDAAIAILGFGVFFRMLR